MIRNRKKSDLCNDVKKELDKILKATKRELVIVIDELDRCRPDFALECLERIKHLFSVDGIKFVLVYNPKVFSGIVMNRYGCDEESARVYIHKFVEFEKTIELDYPGFLYRFIEYETSLINVGDSYSVNRVKALLNSSESIARVLNDYNFTSLRETKHLIHSIMDSLIGIPIGDGYYYNIWYILSLLKLLDYEEYRGIVSYLSMNKKIAMNSPKVSSFLKISSYFMNNKTRDELVDLLETVFNSFRNKFYVK